MQHSSIVCEQSLAVYFRDQLHEHSSSYTPPVQEDTLWYLSNMLARFGNSDQVFTYENGAYTLRPLAMLYSDAHEASSPHHRHLILRQLGDLSLFLGALCPEVFNRKGIKKDYLVGMGGGAYAYLSSNSPKHNHVYLELAETFSKLLGLVSRACSKQATFDAADIFELYQRWKKSKNPLIKKQLEALGITTQDYQHIQ